MLQKSFPEKRAEKEYKYGQKKFALLIRETVSNSIHSVILNSKNIKEQSLNIELNITRDEKSITLKVIDNGEGFTETNFKYFSELDSQNSNKVDANFKPLGQGRLAIIWFTNSAYYHSIFKNEVGEYNERFFYYPLLERGESLFDDNINLKAKTTSESTLKTCLTMEINNHIHISRANTFFNQYNSLKSIAEWCLETFFPFFIEYEKLNLDISYNKESKIINKNYINENMKKIELSINFNNTNDNQNKDFMLFLVPSKEKIMSKKINISCFSRGLNVFLNGKNTIDYEIEQDIHYKGYLTSSFFDEKINSTGDEIFLEDEELSAIKMEIDNRLNKEFEEVINNNREKSISNLEKVQTRIPSLREFVKKDQVNSYNIVIMEKDFIKTAIDEKGIEEINFWEDKSSKSVTYNRIINSSLYIYVEHRQRILNDFAQLIKLKDKDGNIKKENENKIHNLIMQRGFTFKDSDNINHLHNLWLLDDKYGYFYESPMNAYSSKSGEKKSDIYLWTDDPTDSSEIIIIELKSTINAHNPKEMIKQVREYAADFYNNPRKILNWDINTKNCLYTGFIIAPKNDILKEKRSNNSRGLSKIPFLKNSYYSDTNFSASTKDDIEIPIRIEMYSYEDLYDLASKRNKVFYNLLKKEKQQ